MPSPCNRARNTCQVVGLEEALEPRSGISSSVTLVRTRLSAWIRQSCPLVSTGKALTPCCHPGAGTHALFCLRVGHDYPISGHPALLTYTLLWLRRGTFCTAFTHTAYYSQGKARSEISRLGISKVQPSEKPSLSYWLAGFANVRNTGEP